MEVNLLIILYGFNDCPKFCTFDANIANFLDIICENPVIEVNFFNNGVCLVRLSVIALCCVCVTKKVFS